MILAVMNTMLANPYRSLKILDFNRVWMRDFAMPVQSSNQLSYEATDGEPTNY